MQSPFPEVAEMIAAARRYLAGTIHFSELHHFADKLQWVAKAYSAHPAIVQMSKEWANMTDRRWNEFNQHGDRRISEEELRAWVRQQLEVLEPAASSGLSDESPIA